jgi:MFS family permease
VAEPQLALLLTLQFAFGIAFSIFLLLPKIFAAHLHAGPAGIGLVNAMFAIAGVGAVPFVGARVDHPGRPRLIAGGALLMVGASLAFLIVDHVGVVAAALRAVQGAAYTIVFVVGAALAADVAPPGAMARTMALYGSANLITNAVAPLFAEPMIDHLGYRSVYVVAAGAALTTFFLARRLVERAHVPGGGAAGLAVVLRRGRARRIMAAIFLAGIALGAMFTFSQPLALSLGIRQIRSFFIAYTVAVIAVRFLLRDLVDRTGPQRAAVASLGLYTLVVFSMRFLGMGPIGLGTMGGAFGVAHGFLFPAMMALSVTDLPPEERGRMLTLTNGAFIGGTALVLPLGVLAAHAGYTAVFTLGAACALAGAALLARWPVAVPRAIP